MSEPKVDVNVHAGRWPFRRVRGDEIDELADILLQRRVTQAWVGTLEGLFHRDLAAANERLVLDCLAYADLFVPFGSVNPALPDWEEDLRRCHESLHMRGIRLHPNYHGYRLDDPRAERLFHEATQRGLLVQVVLTMEDERTQHPLARVPHVDAAPLAGLAGRITGMRCVALNAFRSLRIDQAAELAAVGDIYFDTAMLEGLGGLARLVARVPLARVLLGSHAPLYYASAAQLKVQESELSGAARRAIAHDNAMALLPPGV